MALKLITLLCAHMLCLCAVNAHAKENILQHFSSGCGMWGTPPSLGMAIADVESGFRPWAVNIQGKSHYLDNKDAALALIRKAAAQRKSYDVGLMQINSYWLRRLNLDPADVLEPKINVIIGCWIIAEEVKRYGLTWKALGAYHTPIDKNPSRARAYVEKVLRAWGGYK